MTNNMRCAKEAADEYYKRDMWLEDTIVEKCHLEEIVTVLKSSRDYISNYDDCRVYVRSINELLVKLTGTS